jgi:hypothetical protein
METAFTVGGSHLEKIEAGMWTNISRWSRLSNPIYHCIICYDTDSPLVMTACNEVMCSACLTRSLPCPVKNNVCYVQCRPYNSCQPEYTLTHDILEDTMKCVMRTAFQKHTKSDLQQLIKVARPFIPREHVLFGCYDHVDVNQQQFEDLIYFTKFAKLPLTGVVLPPEWSLVLTECHKRYRLDAVTVTYSASDPVIAIILAARVETRDAAIATSWESAVRTAGDESTDDSFDDEPSEYMSDDEWISPGVI